jgi:hypothetical protein
MGIIKKPYCPGCHKPLVLLDDVRRKRCESCEEKRHLHP